MKTQKLKTVSIVTLWLAVSTTGLIGCDSVGRKTKPDTTRAAWSVGEVRYARDSGANLDFQSASAGMQNYQLDDQIIFNDYNANEKIKFTVTSACLVNENPSETTVFEYELRRIFQIKEFLSENVLQLLAARNPALVACAFHFRAMSPQGNSHSFTLAERSVIALPMTAPDIVSLADLPAVHYQNTKHGMSLGYYSIRNNGQQNLILAVDGGEMTPLDLNVTLYNHRNKLISSRLSVPPGIYVSGVATSTVGTQVRFILEPNQTATIEYLAILKHLRCRDYRILGGYYGWFPQKPAVLKVLRSISAPTAMTNELTSFEFAPQSVRYFYGETKSGNDGSQLIPATPTVPPTIQEEHEDLCNLKRRS